MPTRTLYVASEDEEVWIEASALSRKRGVSLSKLATEALRAFTQPGGETPMKTTRRDVARKAEAVGVMTRLVKRLGREASADAYTQALQAAALQWHQAAVDANAARRTKVAKRRAVTV